MVQSSHDRNGSVLVLTDLDASLLNEQDYSWAGATAALQFLAEQRIPLVLASSKTSAEMQALARELDLATPLICENGAAINWPDGQSTTLGVDRVILLEQLDSLRPQFQFRSFRDLGVPGIVEATGLSVAQATLANQRAATEPLLWEDAPQRIEAFAAELKTRGLTLTKGGRFWAVAGDNNKAHAMAQVVTWYRAQTNDDMVTVAIGDSPNDLAMLAAADYAIVIPGQDTGPKIELIHPRKTIAAKPGSEGWGSAVMSVVKPLVNHSD